MLMTSHSRPTTRLKSMLMTNPRRPSRPRPSRPRLMTTMASRPRPRPGASLGLTTND